MTIAFVVPAFSQAIWRIGVSGSFETAANWRPASVPDQLSNVVINKAGTYTVSATSDHTVNNLTIGNASTYYQGVTLRVSHSVLQVNGGKIANTGVIQLDKNGGATDSSLLIDGDTTLTGGSGYGAIYMGGPTGGGASVIGTASGFVGTATFKIVNNLIGGSGQIGDANMKIVNQGEIDAWGGVLTLDTGANAIVSSGRLAAGPGATLKGASALSNSGNVESEVGGTITLLSNLTNSGNVDANGLISIAGRVTNSGTIQSFAAITQQGVLNNSGTVEAISFGSTYAVNNNATNTGTMHGHYHGAVHVTGNVNNSTSGALIEATITGSVQIDGNLTNAGSLLANGLDVANGYTTADMGYFDADGIFS